MPRQFIGQDGFYPKWTSRNGRWVFQRVLTTVGTTMDQMETLLRPAESHEALLWAPKRKTILESLRPGDADIRRAIYELQHLPLICCRCDWQGKGPFIRFANYRPAHWRLRCPECESMVEPDVDSIDWDKAKQVLVERWIELRRPRLDPPGAAIALHSIAPISDLARWVDEYDPQENELIYVGQQLWVSFAECVDQLRAEDSIQVVKPWTKRAGQHFVLSTDAGEPRITCSDSTDGRAIWEFVGDQLGFWAPSARNNVVYFGSGDSMLTALDVFNGTLLWKSACPEIVTATPCVNAESVFVGCWGGVVRAFSSRNGELTWCYDPKTESEAVNQVFETDAGIVTITGDGQCRVFSSRTGDVVWDEILPWKDMSSSQDDDEYPPDQDDDEYPSEISKIHHIGAVLVGSKENIWWRTTQFWGRSLITGKEGWSYPVQATACYVSPPFLFYVTDEIEEVYIQPRLVILSINEEDSTDPPEEVGQVELPKVSSPEEIIVHQQTLYGFALDDVFSFDMVSSKLNWVKKLAVSRLLQADEDLLYLIDGTKMVALNAEDGDVVWTRAGVNDIALCNIQELRPEPSRGEEEEEFTIDPLPGIKEEQDETGEVCDRCGKPMVMKIGRFGNFLACTGFPDCRTTKPILNYIGVPCPRPGCNGEIVERRARGGRGPFFGCSTYPHDDFVTNLRPIPTPCPRCGGMMVQQTQDVVSCTACPWREEIR